MKRLLVLLAAVLLLAGCTPSPGGLNTTTSSFPTHQTPVQILSAAVERTAGASSFVLTYAQGENQQLSVQMTRDGRGGYVALTEQPCGCGLYVCGNVSVRWDCENGELMRTEKESAYDLADILIDLPRMEPGFLDRFASFSLTASPSNTGTTCFRISGLRYPDQYWVVTGLYPAGDSEEPDDFDGFFALTVDSAGALVKVEYKDPSPMNPVTHCITITKLNHKTQINAPVWAQ